MAAPNLEMRLREICAKPPAAPPSGLPLVVSFGLLPEEHRQGHRQGGQRHPLGGGQGPPEPPGPVPPEKLQQEAEGPVEGQVDRQQLPPGPPPPGQPVQQQEEEEAPGGLVQLHRHQGHPVGGQQGLGKGHPPPPRRGGDAVAAPGQKAPHPAKGVEEGDGGHQVGPQRAEGQLPPPAEEPHRPQGPQQPPVKHEPPGEVPGGEPGGVLPQQGEVSRQLGQLGQQVEELGPHQGSQHPPEEGLLRPAGVLPPAPEPPVEVPPGRRRPRQGQQAVGGKGSSKQNQIRRHTKTLLIRSRAAAVLPRREGQG